LFGFRALADCSVEMAAAAPPGDRDRLVTPRAAARGVRKAAAVIAAASVAALAVAAAALAASVQSPADTDFTPAPKDGRSYGWTMFDGALFGRDGELVSKPTPSQTPFTVDFFTVRFDPDPTRDGGLAGGAACADPDTPFDRLDACGRVPAIWEFDGADWRSVNLPGGAGGADPSPGYVGAIAYMVDGKVLAVGGGGEYPRRERACSAAEPASCVDDPAYTDPAGRPRAWLRDASGWREVSREFSEAALPSGRPLAGLTALACSPEKTAHGGEFCAAGGLRALVMWEDGHVGMTYDDKSADNGEDTSLAPIIGPNNPVTGGPGRGTGRSSPPSETTDFENAAQFRFRVREIRWALNGFVGVTAGCCSRAQVEAGQGIPSATGPRLLRYASWEYFHTGGGGHFTSHPAWSTSPADDPPAPTAQSAAGAVAADSYFSVANSEKGTSIVASPGGPAPDVGTAADGDEPGARIFSPRSNNWNDSADNADALDLRLDGVRLVAADGDFAGPGANYSALTGSLVAFVADRPDGLPDWAVGSLRSRCEAPARGHCQGAAYTTLRQTQLTPSPLTCAGASLGGCAVRKEVTGGTYSDELTAGSRTSSELMSFPSYSLNSITAQPGQEGKVGWAVGDRGAILRLGGNGTVGSPSDPPPPPLSQEGPRALPDRSGYDSFEPSPVASEPGVVPPLAAQPLDRLAAPVLVAAGSPDPTAALGYAAPKSIAMSRDGSEGWALAASPDRDRSTLYHYAAGTWTACSSRGVPGQLAPDPACAGLDVLREARVALMGMARIPTENGSDPSQADDFEVMALGVAYKAPQATEGVDAIAIYRDGRWSLDDDLAGDLGSGPVDADPVFAAPDDGWLISDAGATGQTLFHFDGERWMKCGGSGFGNSTSATPNSEACGHSEALPLVYNGSSGMRLVAAGTRVYLAATRLVSASSTGTALRSPTTAYPLIYYRDPGGDWTSDYDPGCDVRDSRFPQGCGGASDSAAQGSLGAISVTQLGSGRFAGWAAGTFGPSSIPRAQDLSYNASGTAPPPSASGSARPGLLRLDPDSRSWRPWSARDAVSDYITTVAELPRQLLSVSTPDGEERSLLLPPSTGHDHPYPLLRYDGARGRWELLPAPFFQSVKHGGLARNEILASVRVLAPGPAGEVWLGVSGGNGAYFYRYADRAPVPVFSDVSHPIREPIRAATAGGDGSLWAATAVNAVYRYDRVTGWDRIDIPGWDPGRVVTNPSRVYALAVGAGGSGIVVGQGGRIADVSPQGGVLDRAAGIACAANGNVPPCSTGYDLRAAAVAPDGAAMAGGNHMALLWRPSKHDPFRGIAAPRVASRDVSVTGLSMPSAGRAWLTTDTGELFAGAMTTGCEGDAQAYCWSWTREADPSTLTTPVKLGLSPRLNAIAIDSAGTGLAVGDDGLVLERGEDGSWKRIDTGQTNSFYSVALPPQGLADGALIGGGVGIVLTRVHGRFQVARLSDLWDGMTNGWGSPLAARIVGVALLPGDTAGEVEAWAASQIPPELPEFRPSPYPGTMLHYTNAPSDPLLDGGAGRARPLPDAPALQPDDVGFAAFGKQECQLPDEQTCPEMLGSNLVNEVIARRVTDALQADMRSGAAAFAVFTGDVGTSAGRDQGPERGLSFGRSLNGPIDTDVMHHRWTELVADPLRRAGLPVFGALGAQDLSQTSACGDYPFTACEGARNAGNPGPSLAWREAMAGMAAPWGTGSCGDVSGSDELSVRPVCSGGLEGPSASVCPTAVEGAGQDVSSDSVPCGTPGADTGELAGAVSKASGQEVPGAGVSAQAVPSNSVSAGGAHTHYALDVERGGKPVLRLVVTDTSLRTLSGTAATQNPVEDESGWLRQVLSERPPGERAVVVSNTPTYSYGPGATTDTLSDAASFESLMLQEHVDLVVSGRLGWNGLYYATAPGLHEPCPGGSYPSAPPEAARSVHCSSTPDGAAPDPATAAHDLAGALGGLGAPPPPDPAGVIGDAGAADVVPFVVAASAGGRFGPADQPADGRARDGFWHGYTGVRIDPAGGSAPVVVQRPVFDWVGVRAAAHVLRPGQRMTLKGFGREPVGMDQPIRYDEIDSAAITHRYDLVLADPQKPYLPLEDADGDYVAVPAQVASVDRVTGAVRAGKGRGERTYAVGVLSVGDKAAAWPIAFEPRRSFTPPRQKVTLPPLPRVARAPAAQPPIRVSEPPTGPATCLPSVAVQRADAPASTAAAAPVAPGRERPAGARAAAAAGPPAAPGTAAAAERAASAAADPADAEREAPGDLARPVGQPTAAAAGQPRPARGRCSPQGSQAAPGRRGEVRGRSVRGDRERRRPRPGR
jgi:hypothetical protein